MFKEITELQI